MSLIHKNFYIPDPVEQPPLVLARPTPCAMQVLANVRIHRLSYRSLQEILPPFPMTASKSKVHFECFNDQYKIRNAVSIV